MGKMDLLVHLDTVAPADRDRSCRPFANAVHRQHDCLFKRRRKKRARRVAEVVLAEQ